MPSGLRICQSGCPSPPTPWHAAQTEANVPWPGCGSAVAIGTSTSGDEMQLIQSMTVTAIAIAHAGMIANFNIDSKIAFIV